MSAINSIAARRHYLLRRIVERLSVLGMVLCTSVTVTLLFMILGYVVYNGASAIDWQFLTELPLPPGESGGGIANALVGSVLVVSIATLMAMPIGLGAAIFINEFPSARLGRSSEIHGGGVNRRAIHRRRTVRLRHGGSAIRLILRVFRFSRLRLHYGSNPRNHLP